MNYQVREGDKSYGPFTLAELQAEVQSGRISASAVVQSEGMTDWLPASQVLGDIPVPVAPLPKAEPAASASRIEIPPLPPNLHWVILLVLVLFTNQLFNFIWAFVLGNWARKVEKDNKPLVLVAMYPAGLIGGLIASLNDSPGLGGIMILGGLIAYLIGMFTIKAAIEQYYVMVGKAVNADTPWSRIPSASGAQTLSGVGVIFLSTVYLQYHINKIARWKKTGNLRDTRITP
jgi:hypothetical protein